MANGHPDATTARKRRERPASWARCPKRQLCVTLPLHGRRGARGGATRWSMVPILAGDMHPAGCFRVLGAAAARHLTVRDTIGPAARGTEGLSPLAAPATLTVAGGALHIEPRLVGQANKAPMIQVALRVNVGSGTRNGSSRMCHAVQPYYKKLQDLP